MSDSRNPLIELEKKFTNLEIKRSPQHENSYLTDIPEDMHHDIADYLATDIKALNRLSKSCRQLHAFYQPALNKKGLEQLLQAIVDDQREIVKKILDANSNFLLVEPEAKMVIESQCTWQKFYAENALTMAVKRKQIEMVKILLSYFDKFPQIENVINIKTKALSHYSEYKEEKGKICIPGEYIDYLQTILINAFVREIFPNGAEVTAKLSEETESVLQQFRKIVLPKHPVNLDYLDTDLFLCAVLNTYEDNFDRFLNWHQREHFCVKVVGFAQGLLTPERAKIWCDGIYNNVSEENKPLLPRAYQHKLFMDDPFYRPTRDSVSNLGFEYLCGWWISYRNRWDKGGAALFEKLCRIKSATFQTYLTQPHELSIPKPSKYVGS